MKNFILPLFLTVMSAPSIAIAAPLTIDLTLQIDSMFTPNATVTNGTETFFFDTLAFEDDIWGFPLPLNDQEVGDFVSFKATISDDGAGTLEECSIGSFDCNIAGNETMLSADEGSFELADANYAYFQIIGSTGVGDSFTMSFCSDYRCLYKSGLFFLNGDDTRYSFNVASNNIAPVPLPASLPFLALSIMGFGILRHRQRLS